MTVRLRLALTVFIAGIVSAIGVIATMAVAFERFERESCFLRGDAFLGRVVAMYPDIVELHARDPADFGGWLRSLLLFESDTQLYLLAQDGRVLASTGRAKLPPGFKVALAPVREATGAARGTAGAPGAPFARYVMGDDPEHMNADAVIGARVLRHTVIRPNEEVAGYLYLVAQSPSLADGRLELLRRSAAGPALAAALAVILLTTGLAVWTVASVTRPLRGLSAEVAAAARDGFDAVPEPSAAPRRGDDEFGQLHRGFHALLATLRKQWDTLRRLDRFRREGVSNLSHDLRSPLTAAVASLETLQRRWASEPAPAAAAGSGHRADGADPAEGPDRVTSSAAADRADDLRLVEVALRNAHNAARLVRSLGDLALLDEPEFKLQRVMVDVHEVLDDIAQRFAERAARQGVSVVCGEGTGAGGGGGGEESQPAVATLDIELFERAVANLVDNALKFTPAGGRIELTARAQAQRVLVSVADSGSGIAAHDTPHLFERLYRGGEGAALGDAGERGGGLDRDPVRQRGRDHSAASSSASGEGSKGLGLAIVKRIAELHGGTVSVQSEAGRGTRVTLDLPGG